MTFVGASYQEITHIAPICQQYGICVSTRTTSEYCVGSETPPSYGVTGIPPNQREDFAESVEEYAYIDDRNIKQDESRWEFVDTLFNTGQPPRQ